MAAINCDLCGNEAAVLMQTNLSNGDTSGVGQSCLLTFALGLATAFSEGAEKEEQDAYADAVAGLLANLAPSMLALAKSAVPKPPRKSRAVRDAEARRDEIDNAVATALQNADDEASEREPAGPGVPA